MGSFKDLVVWKKSMDLCELGYKHTEHFPRSELYGLVSQIRKCLVSIPSNIAEGQKRYSRKEFVQFLRIAYASGAELETQLIIANRLGFLSDKEFGECEELLQEIMRMLNKMIKTI